MSQPYSLPQQQTKEIRAKREAERVLVGARGHYYRFVKAVREMEQLLADSKGSELDQADRDRFSALSTLADKHWKVVDRVLPKHLTIEQLSPGSRPQNGAALIQSLIDRIAANPAPVIPAPQIDETE